MMKTAGSNRPPGPHATMGEATMEGSAIYERVWPSTVRDPGHVGPLGLKQPESDPTARAVSQLLSPLSHLPGPNPNTDS